MAKASTDIRSLARSHAEVAIKSLATIAQRGKSESARVAAAVALLDRGFGKAAQTVEAKIAHVDPSVLSDAELAAAVVAGDGGEDIASETVDPSQLN